MKIYDDFDFPDNLIARLLISGTFICLMVLFFPFKNNYLDHLNRQSVSCGALSTLMVKCHQNMKD